MVVGRHKSGKFENKQDYGQGNLFLPFKFLRIAGFPVDTVADFSVHCKGAIMNIVHNKMHSSFLRGTNLQAQKHGASLAAKRRLGSMVVVAVRLILSDERNPFICLRNADKPASAVVFHARTCFTLSGIWHALRLLANATSTSCTD